MHKRAVRQLVGTLCSTANLPPNPSSATMSWEMICSAELHTIPWLTLDHAHVFSHALLGADGVPPGKLNLTRRPLVTIQACLAWFSPSCSAHARARLVRGCMENRPVMAAELNLRGKSCKSHQSGLIEVLAGRPGAKASFTGKTGRRFAY